MATVFFAGSASRAPLQLCPGEIWTVSFCTFVKIPATQKMITDDYGRSSKLGGGSSGGGSAVPASMVFLAMRPDGPSVRIALRRPKYST